jgi:hypothetical protein
VAKLPIRINIATPFTKFKSSITKNPIRPPPSLSPNSRFQVPTPCPGPNLPLSPSKINILSFSVDKVQTSKDLNLPNFSVIFGLLILKNKFGKRSSLKIATFSSPEAHSLQMFTKTMLSFLAVLWRSKISDPLKRSLYSI